MPHPEEGHAGGFRPVHDSVGSSSNQLDEEEASLDGFCLEDHAVSEDDEEQAKTLNLQVQQELIVSMLDGFLDRWREDMTALRREVEVSFTNHAQMSPSGKCWKMTNWNDI